MTVGAAWRELRLGEHGQGRGFGCGRGLADCGRGCGLRGVVSEGGAVWARGPRRGGVVRGWGAWWGVVWANRARPGAGGRGRGRAALTVAPAGPPGAHGAVQDAVHPHQEPADAEAEQQPQHEVDLLLGDVVRHEVVLGGVHHRLVPVVRDHVVDVVPGGGAAGLAGTSPRGRLGLPAGASEAALVGSEVRRARGLAQGPGPQGEAARRAGGARPVVVSVKSVRGVCPHCTPSSARPGAGG